MEILCCLRPVNLVENKCIGVVFSRRDVKRFHARLRPHQRQVLACGLDKLRPALWLNFCFDQHDHHFVRHIGLLLSIFIGRRFTACSSQQAHDYLQLISKSTSSDALLSRTTTRSCRRGIRIPSSPAGCCTECSRWLSGPITLPSTNVQSWRDGVP